MLRVVKKSYDSDPEYNSEYESASYDMVYGEQDLNETYVEGLNDGMIQAYSDVGWEILKIPSKFETELSIQEWIRCNINPSVDGKVVHFLYKKIHVFCVEKKETAAHVKLKFA